MSTIGFFTHFQQSLEGKNAYEAGDLIEKTVQNLIEKNKLEQAAEISRLAAVPGYLLELVAMKYIEQGDLDSAIAIAQAMPTNRKNRLFIGNIERAVAKVYIEERGDLGRAREIAEASYFFDVKETIQKWIEKQNPDRLEFTNREELGRGLTEFNSIFYKA